MSDLLERLEARAAPIEGNPSVGLTYNFPLMWYRRPDGDIVQLQSDPNNRTMYENLGFVMLRPSEAREWLNEVRPGVVLAQKHKAQWITAIRRLAHANPQIIIEQDLLGAEVLLSDMNETELHELYDELCEQYSVRKPKLPPIKPEKEPGKDARMAGVETSDTMSPAELQDKLIRGQGYDPTREARRR